MCIGKQVTTGSVNRKWGNCGDEPELGDFSSSGWKHSFVICYQCCGARTSVNISRSACYVKVERAFDIPGGLGRCLLEEEEGHLGGLWEFDYSRR